MNSHPESYVSAVAVRLRNWALDKSTLHYSSVCSVVAHSTSRTSCKRQLVFG